MYGSLSLQVETSCMMLTLGEKRKENVSYFEIGENNLF